MKSFINNKKMIQYGVYGKVFSIYEQTIIRKSYLLDT